MHHYVRCLQSGSRNTIMFQGRNVSPLLWILMLPEGCTFNTRYAVYCLLIMVKKFRFFTSLPSFPQKLVQLSASH